MQSQDTCQKDASQVLSVSAAMARAKGALENVSVRLMGEVSELSVKSGYKAVYFTVKDERAALPCMMWNNRYHAAGVRLAVGQMVELSGRFTLYAVKGRMNFEVLSLTLAGEGRLRLQVANLARKLEAEGLMNPARKRALPTFPRVVGLVTSPRGAAVHDVLRTLRRRFPMAKVKVAGVPVEGPHAAADIVEGLHCVVDAGAEVVCVVRGGGSFEDLMPFNDENLARAIAACPVPVVTGIGHEPDTSIADMVADVRASTPTAAAEAVSPSRENLDHMLESYLRRCAASMQHTLDRAKGEFRLYAARPLFSDANLLLAAEAQSLDLAADRLFRAIPINLERDSTHLSWQRERLVRSITAGTVREKLRFDQGRDRLLRAGRTLAPRFEQHIALAAARLHDLSPLAVVARGYAVVRTAEGSLVKNIDDAPPESIIEVSVSDGVLTCHVDEARHVDTEVIIWKDAL